MPQLINKQITLPEKVTARFTQREWETLKERAAGLGVSPSTFVRDVVLSALQSTAMERLLLAKLCKVDATIQLLFSGLFQQLNDKNAFGASQFQAALAKAEEAQYRKADELLAQYQGQIAVQSGEQYA